MILKQGLLPLDPRQSREISELYQAICSGVYFTPFSAPPSPLRIPLFLNLAFVFRALLVNVFFLVLLK